MYNVTKEEKLDKITKDFSLLSEEKKDTILGILQALVFAQDITKKETVPFDLEKNLKPEEQ